MKKFDQALVGIERMTGVEVGLTNHHYIVLSQLNKWIINTAAPFARGVLLDYGCGGQPYKKVILPYIKQYIGADVAEAAGVVLDVALTPGQPAPLADGSVDTILSTQVLEHVFDFNAYLDDCCRLLGVNGRLIITVPMSWRHHEIPFDYWRFTHFGIEKSLRQAGFSIFEISPCGGVYSLLGQIYLNHRGVHRSLKPWLIRFVNRIALFMDQRVSDCDDTLCWMCLAGKND